MKRLILTVSALIGLATFGCLTNQGLVSAQQGAKDSINDGIEVVDPTASEQKANSDIENLIQSIVNIFSLLIGAIAVIMLIYGGFKYITSSGDSGAISSAKNTIIYAIVGIVIVVLAQVIVRFVIGFASGNNTSGTSSQQSGSGSGNTPCRQLPNGGCAPGTGP